MKVPVIYYQPDLKQSYSFCFHKHKMGIMASQGYCSSVDDHGMKTIKLNSRKQFKALGIPGT